VTNIPAAAVMQKWPNVEAVRATCAGRDAGRFAATYAFVAEATPLVLFDSSGRVELAVNRGRACDSLAADVGAPVILMAG
jgi:S-adenosylmethionine hydrolase